MKKIFSLLLIGLLGIGFTSCKDDDKQVIAPSDISGLTVDTQDKPGFMVLRWETPQDNTIRYIKVAYHDPLLDKEVVRLASVYSDSLLIPDTRQKFGEYEFKVETVSESGQSSAIQTVKATSEPALKTVEFGESKQITLTAEQLSTNAQEASEGPIANLIDNNTGSYFHSDWHGNATTDGGAKHWFQVDTKKSLTYFKYESVARANSANIPDDIDIMGSNDGTTFELIANLTKAKNGIPMNTTAYTSPVMGDNAKPYQYIRYVVNHTNSGTAFFALSEFKLFAVEAKVVDPEK